MIFHFLAILAVVAFTSASIAFVLQVFSKKETSYLLPKGLLIIGLVFQFLFLVTWFVFIEKDNIINFPSALSVISFLIVLFFLLLERRKSIASLGAFISPIAVCSMIYAGAIFHLDWSGIDLNSKELIWFHISVMLLGYVAFSLAFAVSIALILKESLLKRRLFTALQQNLPPIVTLDLINVGMIWSGFILSLMGIVSGLVISNSSVEGITRLIWPCLILLTYGAVLFVRIYRGIRGRRAAYFSLAGYILVLVSIITGTFSGGGFHVH